MTNKLQISSYGEGILEAVILSGVEGWSVGLAAQDPFPIPSGLRVTTC